MSEFDEDSCHEWIVDIQLTLGCVNKDVVKTGSICRVPHKIREVAKDKSDCYRPQFVAIGPIHRGTTIDLQTMELTKWRYMDKLLRRPTHNQLKRKTVQSCSEAIKGIESIIRASYGDKIEMGSEEFSRMMLLDGCFLLELLLRLLTENETVPSDLDYIDDEKKISRLLTDLMLLENQIPFVLLTILSSRLFTLQDEGPAQQQLASLLALSDDEGKHLSPQKLAESLFGCNGASAEFSKGVYHFLHLIHLCSPDPYQQHDNHRKHPFQLRRCARILQAFGIAIKASPTNDSKGNNKPGTVASAIREFMDKFEFEIEFDARKRELIIPTLHIKEATEVKWRNLIAWEQIGRLIGIGYKFTSYAYFLKGLVCCVHDVQLLKEKGVIKVHTEAKDGDLLIMLQSITTGAEQMDARYRKVCKGLNKAKVKGVAGCCVLIFRMVWHYWRRFLEWLRLGFICLLLSFIDTYLGTPWKFIGFVVGAALLALTIMQTIYAARSS